MKPNCTDCKKCITLEERSRNQRATIKFLQEQIRQIQQFMLAFATKGAGAVLQPNHINIGCDHSISAKDGSQVIGHNSSENSQNSA